MFVCAARRIGPRALSAIALRQQTVSGKNNLSQRTKSTAVDDQNPLSILSNGIASPIAEEKLLNLLALEKEMDKSEDDTMIDKFLPKKEPFRYEALCGLFVQLAKIGRRHVPILKSATQRLIGTTLSPDLSNREKSLTIIYALKALVDLNYYNRKLISKLTSDLITVIDLEDLNSNVKCTLLRSIGMMRWRSSTLINSMYDNVIDNHDDFTKIDHNLMVTLFHVNAHLNFKCNVDLKEVYKLCMKGQREEMLDQNSRKWLNYVWSLVFLNIDEENHIKSVLDARYIEENMNKFSYADRLRLMNLIAIATCERKLDIVHERFEEMLQISQQRGEDMQRLSSKLNDSLSSIIIGPDCLRFDVSTPFGFNIDCEFIYDKKLEAVPWGGLKNFTEILSSFREQHKLLDDGHERAAIIYVPFDELISNHPLEVVGHKQMASRILGYFGYKTLFIPETFVNAQKTSADLISGVRTLVFSSLTKFDPSQLRNK